MGDPRSSRRKFDAPSHPWKTARIQEEHDIKKTYGLKNMREIWKGKFMLRSCRQQARSLLAASRDPSPQVTKEMKQLVDRLLALGLIPADSTLDDILALNVEDVLNRRLQTVVYRKGLSHTIKEARQLIVHGHISIADARVTIPGYLVKKTEEEFITISGTSPLADEAHPARVEAPAVTITETEQEVEADATE